MSEISLENMELAVRNAGYNSEFTIMGKPKMESMEAFLSEQGAMPNMARWLYLEATGERAVLPKNELLYLKSFAPKAFPLDAESVWQAGTLTADGAATGDSKSVLNVLSAPDNYSADIER
jgi:hypothetical protein